MAATFFSDGELDKMKSDAIKRARQMHLRANIAPSDNFSQNAMPTTDNKTKSPSPQSKFSSFNSILQMIKMMGFESDQIILIAIILMLSGEEDSLPIILALLYIAM